MTRKRSPVRQRPSRPKADRRHRGLDRTVVAVLVAAGGVVLIALLRPLPQEIPESLFWARKATALTADCVLAGDFRVYRDLAPAAMQDELRGLDTFNYAWSSSGFSQKYLAAIDQHLDPRSAHPTVVLGITPWSLTPRCATETNFLEYQRQFRSTLEAQVLLGRIAGRLRPVITFVPRLRGRKYHQVFHADGWLASRLMPPDPNSALPSCVDNFDHNPLSMPMVIGLLRQVADWRGRRIRVYAFRPPTTRAMVQLENNLSGFDERAFVEAFISVGGVWIDVPQADAYACYDGSHIVDDSALRLSRDMARTIAWLDGHPDLQWQEILRER
jgi:hypothetical protein